ncbi:MAG TPA: YfhO family protein [Candidatus Anaerostipes excrementavium]|uniref:YfhO family protein n=1 Tax=Candidatus Anaerostipes excrementavium TaxID=2838463 RepID=A0A9D2B9Q5_9FIRM|nr:YfhO family protein [uncultured Anaerostipes sp.]HIX67497.1 YfhO family protein [Candidatus Anaerostipes excrementavium]
MTYRFGDFLRRHKYLIGAFLIPFFMMEIIAVIMEIQPFGNQSFMIVDALHQYLPFFADYQEKLQSMDRLFYSFHGGLGYNFWGLWAYYLSSPLNLIIVFFQKDMLNMVLSHLYVIKIALCCFTAAFYFYKRRGKETFSMIVFGMAYGFSSYIVGYSWNIMWLEVMILFPIILYGFEKMMQGKGWKTYCFALFLSLWCNFYMSFMTCLFLIIWFLLYEHQGVKKFFQNGFCFAFFSLLSAAMAAVVLVPAYLGIMQTSSAKWDFPKELWYGTFGDIFSRHFLGTKPLTMSVDDSDINLYCGILSLIMGLCYLLSREIKRSVRIRRLLVLVILFFSFNMPVLGYIWHGFHNQYGIPNRYAYLYIFVLLSMAYDGYCLVWERRKGQIGKILISLGVLGMIIGAAVYTAKDSVDQNTIYLTLGIGFVYGTFLLLYQKKFLQRKIAAGLLCVGFAAEIIVMSITGYMENGTVTVDEYFQDTKAIEKIKETYDENGSIRMDLASGRMLDESIWHTLNCMTLFGSTAQGNVVDIMDQLGFYTGVNEYLYEGSTPFTNNLFSMQYQIYRPFDSKPTTFQPMDTVGTLTVYKNPYLTSIGYGMKRTIEDWNYESSNPFYVQNDLAQKAYGISGLFRIQDVLRPELHGCEMVQDNGMGEYVIKNKTSLADNVVFTIRAQETGDVYIHFDCSQAENTVIEKNGEEIMAGRLNGQILNLGEMEKGQEAQVKIQLEPEARDAGVVRMTIANMDDAVMSELYGAMKDQSFQMTKFESSEVEGKIVRKNSGITFFSIPYDKGWHAFVDGKEVKTMAIGDAFLGIPTESGEHEITLRYKSAGFTEGAVLSGVGFVLFFLMAGLEFRKKKISKMRRSFSEKYDTLEEAKEE